MHARIQEDTALYHHTVTTTSINYFALIHDFTTYKNSTRIHFVQHLMFSFVSAVLAVHVISMKIDVAFYKRCCREANFWGVVGPS